MYIAAARECREKNPDSPVTLMAARCLEQPLVLMMCIWMRYMDVALMMQESGRGESGSFGDHALYLSASRLASNLRAVSNAYNYPHTTAHGTREYQCASAQLKLLIDKFVFCSRTRTGKPLFSDLVVETRCSHLRGGG